MKKLLLESMFKYLLSGIFILSVGLLEVRAQQNTTGTVVDESNQAIPAVNITVEGTSKGVATDFDGKFSISVSSDDTLIFSSLGYVTQTVKVDGQTQINVILVEDTDQLDEIVLIGYGTAKKSDLTGAIATVSTKSFEDQPLSNVTTALQGRASGVFVSQGGSPADDGIRIRIRGVNSISGNNNPLVVIDGVLGLNLNNVNPNDIATMNVLKDASATAVYGVRGANGVIIITTKKGSGKPKINIEYFTSISSVREFLPTLGDNPGDFARIENSRRTNSGGSPIYSTAEIADLDANGGTNYQREIFRTAVSQNLQASLSGSTDNVKYFVSGNYVDNEGILKTNSFKRYRFRANLDIKMNEKLDLGFNIFATSYDETNTLRLFRQYDGSVIYKALTWDPTTPVFDENGNYNIRSNRGVAHLGVNPIYNLNESTYNTKGDTFQGNFNLNYKITDHLTYTFIGAYTSRNINSQNYFVEGVNEIPDVGYGTSRRQNTQISNILNYQNEFGKHTIKGTALQEFILNQDTGNGYRALDLAQPNGFYFAESAPAAGQTVTNNFTERKLSSFMLRAEYNYDSKLFLTATGRYDGSSVFQEGNQWGFFPSFALAYSFTDLVDNTDFLSTLKVRAGWGQVGSQAVSPYQTYSTLGFNAYAYDGSSPTPGTQIASFANPELTWETTTQTNIGVDFGFMNGRGNISADAYIKNTNDLLLRVPIPLYQGGGSILQNVGEVENKGFDLTLGFDIIETDNFTWNSNLSFSYVKNNVTKLYGDQTEIIGGPSAPGGSSPLTILQEGEPLGQFWGQVFLGTWKSAEATEAASFGRAPGDAKYLRDSDGDIVEQVIGNGTPTSFWGWNNSLTYKKFDLNIFIQGMSGFDVYNIQQAGIVGAGGEARSFMAVEQLNQWTPQNETDIPNTSQAFNSSKFIEDGSFIRISNLNIGYNITSIKGLSSFKVYVGAQNLLLITDYTGYDPEVGESTFGDRGVSIDMGSFPTPRTFNLGVKIGF